MTFIKTALLKDKFALANFILLNETYCEVSQNDLYVIQVTEQYQLQFNEALDFTNLEKHISMSVDKFKQILNLLMTRNLVSTNFVLVGELNMLQYDTSSFWTYIVNKVIDFDKQQNVKNKLEELSTYVTQKFNRYLTNNEINRLEVVIDYFEIEVLKEIVDQCVENDSTYIETFISLINMYKEENCQSLMEVKTTFSSLGM